MSQQTASKFRAFSNPVFICLLLALATLAVYWPVKNYEFIDYDDPGYFFNNPHVLGGFTLANVKWAFTTGEQANWHPFTWLSLMADAEIFGNGAIAPHLTNVLLHAANSILLFLLLLKMTATNPVGRDYVEPKFSVRVQETFAPPNYIWPSAFVAALFALHPLHVESVAWISERKDVLSGFFALLTLICYARFVEESKVQTPKSKVFYILALLFFAFGLMSKPMLVTLPFAMLLLDFWPLKRISNSEFQISNFARLLLEKIPFFLLSAAASVVTFIVQQKGGAVATLTKFSLPERIENAFVSYARYLGKTFWPVNLANPYPHPGHWPAPLVIFSIVLFIALCVAAVCLRKKFPFAFTGWFLFAGMLIPVIGLVQVGVQAMADRYVYLPLIGILIIFIWGVVEICAKWQLPQNAIIFLAAILLFICAARARNQIGFWQNDGTLFSHALAVTKNNYTASINYGAWLSKNGRANDALDFYHRALQMSPDDPTALFDVGNAFAKLGNWDEAIRDYRHALKITPNQPDILDNLGFALAAKKQFAEAVTNFQAALKAKPNSADAHNNLATVFFMQGKLGDAAKEFYAALQLAPDDPRIAVNLGDTFVRLGNTNGAVKCYQLALQFQPDNQKIRAKLQALGVSN